jgi:hypothetical protein
MPLPVLPPPLLKLPPPMLPVDLVADPALDELLLKLEVAADDLL